MKMRVTRRAFGPLVFSALLLSHACRTEEKRSNSGQANGAAVITEAERACGGNKPPTGGGTCNKPTPTSSIPTLTPSTVPTGGKPVVSGGNNNQVAQAATTPTIGKGGGNGNWGSLTITGKRQDCSIGSKVEILIRNKNGAMTAVMAPRKGEVLYVPDVCPLGTGAALVIQTRYNNRIFSTDQAGCFIGQAPDSKTALVGFKQSCPGGDGTGINDIIFSVTCDSDSVTVDKLNLNNALSTGDWIGKDGC